MVTKENFVKALGELRKAEAEAHKERKFDQTVDLIVNLKEFDLKKNPMNLIVELPHKVKDKKVAGFLENKSNVIDTITKTDFVNFKDKVKLKKLVKEYDFFISNAKLMPAVATTFGRALGPEGKMPNPQLGVVMVEDEGAIKKLVQRIDSVIKVRPKEPSIKVSIGKASAKDEDIADNAEKVWKEVFKNLPRGNENVKNVLIKFTMSKPVKVKL